MKIAISYSNGRIAPVFDVSEKLLLIDLDGTVEIERREIFIADTNVLEKTQKLAGLGITVLMCGAVSAELENFIRKTGIDLKCFLCGEVDSVLQAFLKKRLDKEDFRMPGCCKKRRMHRRGHC